MPNDQLPKCLFKEGTETQVDKVNNSCKASILELAKECIEAEYNDVLEDPLFGQVLAIHDHGLGYSGRVIHHLVCEQLLSAKRHELWFLFARRPLRFSMQEFYAVTGLKYKEEPDLDVDTWKADNGFWSTLLRRKKKISIQQIKKVHLRNCSSWSHLDRLRLVYLCVIAGMLMAKDEKVWIPHKYIRLVMDFDKMRKYPWGLDSYDMLVTSVIEARTKVKTQNSYVINGFSYALQVWAMEAVPDIGIILGEKLSEGVFSMRCRNWKGSEKVSYEDIYSIESDFGCNGQVFPYISSIGNFDLIAHEDFLRTDEMKDERVDLIIDMYKKKYDWSKHVWAYRDIVLPAEDTTEGVSSEELDIGETSETTGLEEERESTHVTVKSKSKRKSKFQDIGDESRKKRLLSQRSTEKYRDLEVEMKSYIHGLFKSAFCGLEEVVRDTIEDKFEHRFSQFEEKFLSAISRGPVHIPAPAPASTHSPAPAPDSTHTTAPHPPSAHTTAPGLSTAHTTAPGPSTATTPSRTRVPITPAPARKTRSQTKDEDINDSFDSLFGTIDDNLGTQEHLHKTMGNLTQESNVKGFDPSQTIKTEEPEDFTMPSTSFHPDKFKKPFLTDIDLPEVCCKDSDYGLVFVSEKKWSKLVEWSLKPK